MAGVSDPFGNLYWLQTRIEEVNPAELERRMTDPEFTTALFMPETR